jgi:hypothetical protein
VLTRYIIVKFQNTENNPTSIQRAKITKEEPRIRVAPRHIFTSERGQGSRLLYGKHSSR